MKNKNSVWWKVIDLILLIPLSFWVLFLILLLGSLVLGGIVLFLIYNKTNASGEETKIIAPYGKFLPAGIGLLEVVAYAITYSIYRKFLLKNRQLLLILSLSSLAIMILGPKLIPL